MNALLIMEDVNIFVQIILVATVALVNWDIN